MQQLHGSHRPSLAILALLLLSGSATATEVWVVSDSHNPVTGTHAPDRVIELDAPSRLEAQLSARLPTDPLQASQRMQQRLAQGGQQLHRRLQSAYQGVTDAWSLGITAIPAVVVDRRYVVYGEADLDQALDRVAQYRKEQP
uniref:TIGR03757 family integrating conjugative element protein n=1 Tax=Marinobacterium profundum TaxID=1714300 RepID=UPI00082EF775|nr:TIGR03757 family integrating conjugative element protein [Marinobacterium profundum]